MILADIKDIATIITAVGGIVVGIVTALIKRNKPDNKGDDTKVPSTSTMTTQSEMDILQGYAQIVGDLRQEITRIRTQYTEDLTTWQTERAKLLEELAEHIGQEATEKEHPPLL